MPKDGNNPKMSNFEDMLSKTRDMAQTLNRKSAQCLEISRKTGNMRMRVVIYQFEIFILEIKDTLHVRVYFHLWQWAWFTGKL